MKDVDRNLFRFFGWAFLWSWILWTPLVLAGFGIIPLSNDILKKITLPISIVAAYGPLFGALMTLRKGDGKGAPIGFLKRSFDLGLGWKAYVYPVLILGGSTALAWVIPELFGEPRLPMLVPSVWVFIPYLLIMIFLGGGQEEFGWRGYALPRLEQRLGLWRANTVLGIVWAFWHIPLWFIPGTSQTFMHFGGFILLTIGYSFLFSWILEISGNKPFSGLFTHGVANAFVPFMPVLVLENDVAQTRYWIWVVLTFLIGAVITTFRLRKDAGMK